MIFRSFVSSAGWLVALSATLSLVLSPAQAQSSDEAQGLPEGYVANEFQTFSAAIALDDKCSALSYQHRALLDDMVLGSLLDLPMPQGAPPAEVGTPAYYENIDNVAAPLGEAARARAAAIPCEQADQFLGQVRLSVIADLVALVELSDGQFEQVASYGDQLLARKIFDDTKRALQGAPKGVLERFVQARMLRHDVSGYDAAQYALDNLRPYKIALAINAIGKDLRRDGAREGWVLWDPATRSATPDLVFADPWIAVVLEGRDDGEGKYYGPDTRAVILPYKGRELEFALLPLSQDLELGPVEAVISAGSGAITAFGRDYIQAQATAYDVNCLEGARCLRFDSRTTRSIERRVQMGMKSFEMQMVLVRPQESEIEETPAQIRRMTRPVPYANYNPPVEDLFPEAAKAAR